MEENDVKIRKHGFREYILFKVLAYLHGETVDSLLHLIWYIER